MHTFDEALALSDYEQPNLSPSEERNNSSNKFFTLLVQRSPESGETVIKMWSVRIATQKPVPISDQEVSGPFKARSYSLAGPQFYASALPIVPTAARLSVETKKIYEATVDFLPDDVQVRLICEHSAQSKISFRFGPFPFQLATYHLRACIQHVEHHISC